MIIHEKNMYKVKKISKYCTTMYLDLSDPLKETAMYLLAYNIKMKKV